MIIVDRRFVEVRGCDAQVKGTCNIWNSSMYRKRAMIQIA